MKEDFLRPLFEVLIESVLQEFLIVTVLSNSKSKVRFNDGCNKDRSIDIVDELSEDANCLTNRHYSNWSGGPVGLSGDHRLEGLFHPIACLWNKWNSC